MTNLSQNFLLLENIDNRQKNITDLSKYLTQLESQLSLIFAASKLVNKVIKLSRDGIVITDALLPDNPIIYVNESFIKTSGYTQNELIGSNCRVLQSDDNPQKHSII